ncbi:MAG: hypothetical protein ACXW61_01880 [Gemmatirosa sp.]
MLLPNLVLIGACMFAAAALARQALATYVGGLALYVVAILAGDFTDGFSNRTLSALAYPFGGATIVEVMRFWTPAERSAFLIGWPEIMLCMGSRQAADRAHGRAYCRVRTKKSPLAGLKPSSVAGPGSPGRPKVR